MDDGSGGSDVGMCIASGADRHLDITFGLQVVESSSLASVLIKEAFNHPYISFFHLLVNGFSVIYIYARYGYLNYPPTNA